MSYSGGGRTKKSNWSSIHRNVDFFLIDKTNENMAERILRQVFLGRIKHNKPCIVFIAGGSGEGKSMGLLRIAELIAPHETTDYKSFLKNQMIYTPFEYSEKMRWILYSKEAKGKHILCMPECREMVKSKTWYSLINQAISDVNAMSRSVKPIIFLIASQSSKDIDKDIRNTVTYYGTCWRPLNGRTKMVIKKIHNDLAFEDAKFTEYPLRGIAWSGKDANEGCYRVYNVSRFIMNLPSPDFKREYDDLDKMAKTDILLKKLERMQRILELEKPKFDKVGQIADFIIKDATILKWAVKRSGATGKVKVKDELAKMQGLNKQEKEALEETLERRFVETGHSKPTPAKITDFERIESITSYPEKANEEDDEDEEYKEEELDPIGTKISEDDENE